MRVFLKKIWQVRKNLLRQDDNSDTTLPGSDQQPMMGTILEPLSAGGAATGGGPSYTFPHHGTCPRVKKCYTSFKDEHPGSFPSAGRYSDNNGVVVGAGNGGGVGHHLNNGGSGLASSPPSASASTAALNHLGRGPAAPGGDACGAVVNRTSAGRLVTSRRPMLGNLPHVNSGEST